MSEERLRKDINRLKQLTNGCIPEFHQDIEDVLDRFEQLKEVIEEVRKSIEDYQEYIEEAKKMYSDLDDDNVVKASCMQLLNNQMVRNYEVLQILAKVGVKDV